MLVVDRRPELEPDAVRLLRALYGATSKANVASELEVVDGAGAAVHTGSFF